MITKLKNIYILFINYIAVLLKWILISMFYENYKTNITEYYTVPIQLNCFWSKQNPLLSNIEKSKSKN
jgi:hypothetical protein